MIDDPSILCDWLADGSIEIEWMETNEMARYFCIDHHQHHNHHQYWLPTQKTRISIWFCYFAWFKYFCSNFFRFFGCCRHHMMMMMMIMIVWAKPLGKSLIYPDYWFFCCCCCCLTCCFFHWIFFSALNLFIWSSMNDDDHHQMITITDYELNFFSIKFFPISSVLTIFNKELTLKNQKVQVQLN